MTYDWQKDSAESYLVYVDFKRKQGLAEGRFQPVNDDERAYVAAHKRGAQ